ncbi:MAG TPA: AAA family ATPase [Candidatus Diapherotrites archaeon]|nr:AAA family ATPase [Candidatus Diapherotrites archaeon]
MVSLTQEQQNVVDKIADWFHTCNSPKKFFKLGGLAGTGKTTIIPNIIERCGLRDEVVALAAFTGKAASVIRKKTNGRYITSTIHNLIYSPQEYINEETGKNEIRFIKKPILEIPIKLIIIDESSMINEEIHNDLLSFNIPVINIGDHGQLPPVASEFNLMDEDKLDAKLETIHRQAENNPIIKIAFKIRNNERIPDRLGNTFLKMKYKDLRDETLLGADQILCGKNATRNHLNKIIRELKGFSNKLPTKHEKVIVLQNNNGFQVYNGQQFYTVGESFQSDVLTFTNQIIEDFLYEDWLKLDKKLEKEKLNENGFDIGFLLNSFDSPHVNIRSHPISVRNFIKLDYDILKNEFEERIYMDFAYAITTHKSQGSEWEKVLIVDDNFGIWDRELRKRWLYTAVTRAKEKLIIAEF